MLRQGLRVVRVEGVQWGNGASKGRLGGEGMDIEGFQNVVRYWCVIKDESIRLWVGSHNITFMVTHVGFVGGELVGIGIPISERC